MLVHILNAQEVIVEVRTCVVHDLTATPRVFEHNWQIYPHQAVFLLCLL